MHDPVYVNNLHTSLKRWLWSTIAATVLSFDYSITVFITIQTRFWETNQGHIQWTAGEYKRVIWFSMKNTFVIACAIKTSVEPIHEHTKATTAKLNWIRVLYQYLMGVCVWVVLVLVFFFISRWQMRSNSGQPSVLHQFQWRNSLSVRIVWSVYRYTCQAKWNDKKVTKVQEEHDKKSNKNTLKLAQSGNAHLATTAPDWSLAVGRLLWFNEPQRHLNSQSAIWPMLKWDVNSFFAPLLLSHTRIHTWTLGNAGRCVGWASRV